MTRHIAERYIRFAQLEAAGQSPIYERLALHVARSQNCLGFLLTLPADRQQPNLLFAAVRHVAGNISCPEAFDRVIRDRAEEVAAVMRRRTTQTNEPGRCAVLLPLLAQITGPIALIEMGASAGLCLLPDVYGYDGATISCPRRRSLQVVLRYFSATHHQAHHDRWLTLISSGGWGWI